jgi:glycosyltransferase involved in cell wall biosynthesis
MTIAIVIPCYNVATHIESVIRSLPGDITHIIAVNDCSKDDTESILLRLQQEYKNMIYIKHDVNEGVGGAMLTGYKRSLELNADLTIKIDGDDQMDTSLYP